MHVPRRRALAKTLEVQNRVSSTFAESLPTPELKDKIAKMELVLELQAETMDDIQFGNLQVKLASYKAVLASRDDK